MSRLLTAACLLLVAALAACGGGATTELTVDMFDVRFEPDAWTVAAGEPISLTAVNQGFLDHEFLIVRQGSEITRTDQLTDAAILFNTGAVAGQTSGDFTFTVPEAGTYQVICAIDSHFDGGMAGTLTVSD